MATKNSAFRAILRALTPSCQSGRNAGTLAGLLAIAAMAPAEAGPTGWAHQAAGFQSNGAVTVKSVTGGSYAGTLNPSGAVAKANQSAATQAPTVIIQATSTAQQELRTYLRDGNGVYPACPAGFTSVFQSTTSQCTGTSIIYNAGGTRLTLGTANNAGSIYLAFFTDSTMNSSTFGNLQGNYSPAGANSNNAYYCGNSTTGFVSAEICAK